MSFSYTIFATFNGSLLSWEKCLASICQCHSWNAVILILWRNLVWQNL
jgi:hypothetical protein